MYSTVFRRWVMMENQVFRRCFAVATSWHDLMEHGNNEAHRLVFPSSFAKLAAPERSIKALIVAHIRRNEVAPRPVHIRQAVDEMHLCGRRHTL
jgi:hypothetical protein